MEPDAAPAGVPNVGYALGRRRGSAGTTMSPCEELADGGRLGRPSRWGGATSR